MKSITGIAITLTLAASIATANAATATYNGNSLGHNTAITVSGLDEQVFAGLMNIGLTGAPADYPTVFKSVCVDLDHSISQGQSWDVNLTPLPNPGLNNSGRVAYLYSTYADTVASNDAASGLQLAIWDIVKDSGDGFGSGAFRAYGLSSGTLAAANGFISDSAGKTGSATWLVSTSGQKQNLLAPRTCGTVPEASSLSLIGTAILPLLGFIRRRK